MSACLFPVLQLVCKPQPLSVNSPVPRLRHTCFAATKLWLPTLQLLTNLPDRSAVTTVSPGVAYCVAAPDGSFFAPFCTTNHITFLQQFMDAGCADAVDVMNVHIYQ